MSFSKSIRSFLLLAVSPAIFLSIFPRLQAQVPKGDVYVGYSRTGNGTFYPGVGGLNGWEGAFHVKVHKPFLGIEGDLSHYGLGSDSSVPRTTVFLMGPRITLGGLGPKAFAHALIGGEHSANSSSSSPVSGGALAYTLGGGVDIPLVPLFAWRVAGDYIRAPTQSPGGSTPARFSTGVVFRF